jgi:hypothetical protein
MSMWHDKSPHHRSDKDNDKNEMVEAGGLAKRGNRVERISESCPDENGFIPVG